MKKLSTLLLIAAVAAGIDANSAEVTRIAAGNHTMLLTKDGKIYVSGNNDAGQLGDGHYFDSEISDNHYNATTFKPVEKDGVKFRSVTATLYNSYAIASDGARREGTLSFRMPEKTFGGAALEGTLNVRIAIEGVDTVTISGKNPGELVSLPLTLPDGTARIVVTADNAKGYGLQSRVKTQVGVDQPMPAENVSLRVDGGEATLSWTAPTTGKNGGYVGNLTYRVERNDGVVVAEATTETSLTGLQKGKYSLTEYKVTAANESGAASAATSNSVILGDALAMPFKESFDGGT